MTRILHTGRTTPVTVAKMPPTTPGPVFFYGSYSENSPKDSVAAYDVNLNVIWHVLMPTWDRLPPSVIQVQQGPNGGGDLLVTVQYDNPCGNDFNFAYILDETDGSTLATLTPASDYLPIIQSATTLTTNNTGPLLPVWLAFNKVAVVNVQSNNSYAILSIWTGPPWTQTMSATITQYFSPGNYTAGMWGVYAEGSGGNYDFMPAIGWYVVNNPNIQANVAVFDTTNSLNVLCQGTVGQPISTHVGLMTGVGSPVTGEMAVGTADGLFLVTVASSGLTVGSNIWPNIGPAVSPRLLLSPDKTCYIWNAPPGDYFLGGVDPGQWLPQGSNVTVEPNQAGLMIIPTNGGTPVQLAFNLVPLVAFSTDGARYLCMSYAGQEYTGASGYSPLVDQTTVYDLLTGNLALFETPELLTLATQASV